VQQLFDDSEEDEPNAEKIRPVSHSVEESQDMFADSPEKSAQKATKKTPEEAAKHKKTPEKAMTAAMARKKRLAVSINTFRYILLILHSQFTFAIFQNCNLKVLFETFHYFTLW